MKADALPTRGAIFIQPGRLTSRSAAEEFILAVTRRMNDEWPAWPPTPVEPTVQEEASAPVQTDIEAFLKELETGDGKESSGQKDGEEVDAAPQTLREVVGRAGSAKRQGVGKARQSRQDG